MSRVFLISDHHLGHDSVLKFEREGRRGTTIDEHNQWLMQAHNSRVTKRDTVWFLGDVAFRIEALELLKQFNGTLNLVLGNHDNFDWGVYAKYFSKVKALHPYKGGVLTHVPVHNSELDRWALNYHGHIHSKQAPSEQHINCCVEQCDGVPRTLEEWQRRQ